MVFAHFHEVIRILWFLLNFVKLANLHSFSLFSWSYYDLQDFCLFSWSGFCMTHEVVFVFFMKLANHHAFAHFHEFGKILWLLVARKQLNMSMCPSVGLSVGWLETLLLFGLLGANNAAYSAQCLFWCIVFTHFLEISFCAFSWSQKNNMVFAYFREAENLLWFLLISIKLTIFHGFCLFLWCRHI